MVCCLCCGERVPGPSPVGQCGSVSTRPLVPLACACPGFWLKRKKKSAPPRSPCRRVEKKHHNTGVETAARALAFAALVPFAFSLDRFQSRPERLLCFVFYPLSLSGSLSGCQCWDPLLGRARGKNKEKRRHLRAFLQRAPRTNPILHEVLGARPTLSKKLLSYFQRSTRWDMEKYCDSRVFPTFGGSQKRRFALFYVLVFRIPLSKHYLSVRVFATVAYLFACEHEMNKAISTLTESIESPSESVGRSTTLLLLSSRKTEFLPALSGAAVENAC